MDIFHRDFTVRQDMQMTEVEYEKLPKVYIGIVERLIYSKMIFYIL